MFLGHRINPFGNTASLGFRKSRSTIGRKRPESRPFMLCALFSSTSSRSCDQFIWWPSSFIDADLHWSSLAANAANAMLMPGFNPIRCLWKKTILLALPPILEILAIQLSSNSLLLGDFSDANRFSLDSTSILDPSFHRVFIGFPNISSGSSDGFRAELGACLHDALGDVCVDVEQIVAGHARLPRHLGLRNVSPAKTKDDARMYMKL